MLVLFGSVEVYFLVNGYLGIVNDGTSVGINDHEGQVRGIQECLRFPGCNKIIAGEKY